MNPAPLLTWRRPPTDLAATADRHRAAYRAAVAGEPLARTEFGFDLWYDPAA